MSAYYRPLGDGRYLPSEHTIGPWSDKAQHFGPPSALLGRALQRVEQRQDTALAKLTVDILGPLPPVELQVTASVLRPGRTVELVGAELAVDGRVLARASGWRLAVTDTAHVAGGAAAPMPAPEHGHELPMPDVWHTDGYLSSIEWRWLSGSWAELGPAAAWGRPRYELVDGEPTTGVCRLLTVVDSASGLSGRLDPMGWLFPNTDLTVHLHRSPIGDWVGVQAQTTVGPAGAGVATSIVFDQNGAVGNSMQLITVRSR